MKINHASLRLSSLVIDCALILALWAFLRFLYSHDFSRNLPFFHWPFLILASASFVIPFFSSKIYAVLWTHSYLKDTYRLIIACAVGTVLFLLANHFSALRFPVSFALLYAILFALCAIGWRIAIRDFFARHKKNNANEGFFTIGELPKEHKILIVGAGEAGRLVLSEFYRKAIDHHIVGFIDDDTTKVGMIINGKKVFATTEKIGTIIKAYGISEIILAFPSAPKKEIARVVHLIRKSSPALPIKILPSHTKLFENPLTPDIREIGIADLLDREETQLDTSSIEEMLAGKKVLITGAGGSIGSEICKQLLKFPITSLVAIGKGEHSIYQLARALFEYQDFLQEKRDIAFRIVDIRNREMIQQIFFEFSPHIVFHAAAHKHVPLLEFNETEAILNNILGTKILIEEAKKANVERFVFVSTDKAVRPRSIMGATKRAAEIIIQSHAREGFNASIVRFGNVIGSRGSVIPLFREQIERGGPVTVTHPEITRFFMSIPEAALLVLNAAAYAKGGEIFVLEMGRQYRVMEIAENLIRLYGLQPHKDIEIKITGLRPGEKMNEELSHDGTLQPTKNPKIYYAKSDFPSEDRIHQFFQEIISIHSKSPLEIRQMLKDLIPEYEYDCEEILKRNARRVVI
ncbi:MAG: polysaccharide biosynthesis protein [Spirochaetes bacterium]|nr:polysaccharide biosynthesis protein [Spirochaetota bacterium]